MDSTSNGPGGNAMRLAVILAGLFGGLALGAVSEFEDSLTNPQESGLYTLAFFLSTVFMLTAAPKRFTSATILSVLVGLLIGGLSYKVSLFRDTYNHTLLDDGQSMRVLDTFVSDFWFRIGSTATAYILTVFGLTAIEEKAARWPYGRVFRQLVGIPVQWLFGLAVAGLLNGFIWLWGMPFEIIGIDLISKIWDEPLIWMPMTGAFFGLGVALARQWQGITTTLRTLCRYVARFALPIFAAFAVTLLIALPVQGLEKLFASTSAAGVMSALAAFTIFLVYGARQDLTDRPPPWLRIATAVSVLGLPVYSALAVYAMWLRVGQHGFTPGRYVGFVLVVILFLHATGLLAVQALDLVRRRNWLAGAGTVNMVVLALLAAFFIAMHTPQLDPYIISAQSQYQRLAEGRKDARAFDYGYLRFSLGPAGERALERLKSLDSHPDIAEIRKGIALAEKAKNYYEWQLLQKGEQPPQPRKPAKPSAPEG